MTTLVTGAAGFLGRHVIDELLERGKPVRAMVRHAGQADALQERGADVVVGDVRDREAVRTAMRDVDTVQHCAAAVAAHYSSQEIYSTNLDGVRNLLDALRSRPAGSARLVLISSLNVLGNRHLDRANENFPTRRAGEPRADVKIDAERLALDHHRRYGVDVTILRPGLIYGPGEPNIPKMLNAIRRGKFAYIGSQDNIIPMVHVRDVVQAMLLAAETRDANGRIYHITDGENRTIRELVDYLAELIQSPRPQKVLPYFVPWLGCRVFEALRGLRLTKKAGPINRVGLRFLGTSRSIDIRRARQELGYEPQESFRDAMAATVRWIEQGAGEESLLAESRR